MVPVNFPEANTLFAADQPQYQKLPAHVSTDDSRIVTTCWRLTWREWFSFLFTGRVWLQQMTFKQALQPQLPNIQKPELLA